MPADYVGGWSCHVEQGRYGHVAKKATWLYANGIVLPVLRWGYQSDASPGLVSWCRNHNPDDTRPRVGKKVASKTPAAFRDELLSMARTVTRRAA